MHILLGLLVLICFFISPSFRLMVAVLLGSLVFGAVLGFFIGFTFDESLGVLVGLLAFLYALYNSFKICRFLLRVIERGVFSGLKTYADERSRGEKHESALAQGGQDGLLGLLEACAEEDLEAQSLKGDNENKSSSFSLVEKKESHAISNPALEGLNEALYKAIRSQSLVSLNDWEKCLSVAELYHLVNSADANGSTPLHTAVQHRNNNALYWLLKHGADMEALNYWGHTPLKMAQRLKNREAFDYLYDKMMAAGLEPPIQCELPPEKVPLPEK